MLNYAPNILNIVFVHFAMEDGVHIINADNCYKFICYLRKAMLLLHYNQKTNLISYYILDDSGSSTIKFTYALVGTKGEYK